MIALILTTYNRPEYLNRCLDSLRGLTELPDLLVIVDDASDQPTKDILYNFTLDCQQHHFYKKENLGIKNSLLRGCDFAFQKCDLVVNLDADAIVKPNFITEIKRLKKEFPEYIVSGFNCNNLNNPVIGTGQGYVIRKRVNGINLCFDKVQYEHSIKPALLQKGDWDHKVEGDFIISSPSLVQHIGEHSSMGHPMFDIACDFDPKEITISIIHPSRGRPDQASVTVRKWLDKAKDPSRIEYILSIDYSDAEENRKQYRQINRVYCYEAYNNSCVEAANAGAAISKGDILILVSDDFDCPYHWDELLISCLRGKEDFVVKTDDGTQPWIITLPIMDRKYYNRFGYIYNPEYKHMFCDTEMTHVADLLGRKITLPITFPHNHYTTGKVAKDELNERNDSTWDQGKEVYLKGVANNFGLTEIRGKLACDPNHIAWLANEGVEASVRPLLTILIPTINGREREFDTLVKHLLRQINHNPDVEILFAKDNKEISIGAKRQGLLNSARGEYVVFIDDDDNVADDYIEFVLKALQDKPDCVGYLEKVSGEREQVAIHSNSFSGWAENVAGYDYVRTPFYKTPLKTEIARSIGFSDARYGEDKDFSDRLKKSGLIQKEIFIDKLMYFYSKPTGHNHEERYGIK